MPSTPSFFALAAARGNRWLGRVRLVTGLILFAYVLTHNLNHALGIVSLRWLEAGRYVFLAFWRFPPIEWALFIAVFLHLTVALIALYRRRSLKMPFWEGAQLVLGLATPPLLMLHVLGTAYASERFDFEDSYAYVLLSLWVFLPGYGALQALAVLTTWIHGCIGMGYWLRLKPWFPKARPCLFAFAVVLPVLALIGFADAGRAVAEKLEDETWLPALKERDRWPDATAATDVHQLQIMGFWICGALLGGVLVARVIRDQIGRARAIEIQYENGAKVRIQSGMTVLEASRSANIPHASVCGGRGRCSTCRVKILKGAAQLPIPSDDERRVLARVGAAPDTRLACQLRPNAPLTVAPLLPAQAGPQQAHARGDYHSGRELEIAVLFADLRGFTQLSEQRLPYDVVFLLNRYFKAMGEAVSGAGGHLDKFIGDGVMALFGIESGMAGDDGQRACTQALEAARRMSVNLEELNRHLVSDLKQPLRIGIGIHFGPVIVGDMGYGANQHLTAIGDTVNTASRLETATKEFGAQLVISDLVARRGGLAFDLMSLHQLQLRGREQTLGVLAFPSAQVERADAAE
ncbi:adenylate/guanylate cyclase domain-containing protein [Dongia rigui]|uniref:Adenylate/guanylate cyclase domain-containing protein n=1 Tax=Dongia rigui TaxID=940149 RepID=A0ABU5DX51_9PROT|nr:adenylate/guanylate cyclase domain-containing protein [Dongia rigui]MDY0871854.1 adenylate/guanylate cyclase domain-containing protein [Dongia rigui]